jgi:Uma2 family endonuclease
MSAVTQPQPIHRYTPEEYLCRERDATERHEYYHGEVFAMAGGSPDHSLICSNVNREIGNRLKGTPCRAYESNLRVRVPRTTLYTYPDVSVICGERQFDLLDTNRETVLNPALIVEVLSPSTESWDRGGKFQNYRQIESLREYVLVSTDKPLVETFLRQPDGTWNYTPTAGRDARAALRSLGIELPAAEIYDGVDLPAPATDRSQL